MKKLMFIATAALCGAVMAAGEITSANIVGYQQKETPQAKFRIGTAPFEAVDGTLDIQKLLSGFSPVEIDWEDETAAFYDFQKAAAQLQIWDLSIDNYVKAFYVSNAWYNDGTEDGSFKEGWCDTEGELLEDYEMTPGGAYWVKNVPDDKNLNIAGAVKTADSVSYPCTENFALAGNAFPVDIELNGKDQMKSDDMVPVEIDWEDETAAFYNFQKTSTQLQIYNDSIENYNKAFYVSNAWYNDGTEDGAFKEGWCDTEGELLEDYTIPSGNGFWVRALSGDCTLDFINPIEKE